MQSQDCHFGPDGKRRKLARAPAYASADHPPMQKSDCSAPLLPCALPRAPCRAHLAARTSYAELAAITAGRGCSGIARCGIQDYRSIFTDRRSLSGFDTFFFSRESFLVCGRSGERLMAADRSAGTTSRLHVDSVPHARMFSIACGRSFVCCAMVIVLVLMSAKEAQRHKY